MEHFPSELLAVIAPGDLERAAVRAMSRGLRSHTPPPTGALPLRKATASESTLLWAAGEAPFPKEDPRWTDAAAGEGLEALLTALLHGFKLSGEAWRSALAAGRVDVFAWLLKPGVWPKEHVDTISSTLSTRPPCWILNDWHTANDLDELGEKLSWRVAAGGHLETLKWLIEDVGCRVQLETFFEATQNGHLEVLKWAHSKGLELWVDEYLCVTSFAICGGYKDTILWCHENVWPINETGVAYEAGLPEDITDPMEMLLYMKQFYRDNGEEENTIVLRDE